MRRIDRIVAVLLGGCCLLACGCQGERRSDDALREAVKSGNCPGYVAYSLELGREEWSCLGWADAESERQMAVNTVFRICSMTKSFVGALAAVLADRGEIDLDTSISQTFPEYTGEKSDITLRQCLSMTAGFAEMSPTMLDKGIGSQDPSDVALEMAGVPLESPPGTHYKYSNSSFEIAAAVMERRTGRKLEELMDNTFFRPLGMHDTTFHPTHEMLTRLATLYRMRDGGGYQRIADKLLVRPCRGAEDHISASGGLYSTPNDIMKFYQMLLRGGMAEDGSRVMSEGAIRLIIQKQTPAVVPEWYSFGFFKGRSGFLGHGGAYGTVAECDLHECRVRMIFTQTCGGQAQKQLLRKWRKSTTEEFDEVALTGSRFFVGNE